MLNHFLWAAGKASDVVCFFLRPVRKPHEDHVHYRLPDSEGEALDPGDI